MVPQLEERGSNGAFIYAELGFRIIFLVRDPTTRSLSDYAQTLYKLQAKKTIRKNMSYEKLALRETTNGSKTVNDRWGAIKIGVYSKHLRRWLNYFPLEQIHLVSGEALVHKPYPEIKKVERFLGLPSFIKREQFVYNKAKKFYCFNRSLSYESPGPSEAPRCLGTTKGRLHPKISYETEKLLRDYFRPFNKELYDLTGRNFGWR